MKRFDLTRSPVLAIIAIVLGVTPAGSATLSFSGGAAEPPTDVVSYLRHVYCDRLPPGGALKDRSCRSVLRWISLNAGRPNGAWSPPPILD